MDIDSEIDENVTSFSMSHEVGGPGEEEVPAAVRGTTGSRRPVNRGCLADVITPPMDDDLNQESAALSTLAQAFSTVIRARFGARDPTPVSPAAILQLAVDCVPRVEHAALVAVVDGKARTLAATHSLSERIDQIRSDTGQGPGLDVLRTSELVLGNDLGTDPRWPLFGPRLVDELGLRSVVSYRLHLGSERRAALCWYSHWPYAFDDLTVATGALFAAYCSLTGSSYLPHGPNTD